MRGRNLRGGGSRGSPSIQLLCQSLRPRHHCCRWQDNSGGSAGSRTLLIGAYLTQSTLDHLPDLEEELNRFPGKEPVLLGDLNTDIGRLRNPWGQQVKDYLASLGMVDLLDNFRQRLRYRNLNKWWQVCQGQILWSRCDYVL